MLLKRKLLSKKDFEINHEIRNMIHFLERVLHTEATAMVIAFSHSGPLKMTSICIVGVSFTQVLATRMLFVVDYSLW